MSSFAVPSAARVSALVAAWPAGSRVELVSLEDPYPGRLRPGCLGSVVAVDSVGTVHVAWDCGSSLGLVPGVDAWRAAPAAAPKPAVVIHTPRPAFSAPAAAAVFGDPALAGLVAALRAADLAVGEDPASVLPWSVLVAFRSAASVFLDQLLLAGCPAAVFEPGADDEDPPLGEAVFAFVSAAASATLAAARELA